MIITDLRTHNKFPLIDIDFKPYLYAIIINNDKYITAKGQETIAFLFEENYNLSFGFCRGHSLKELIKDHEGQSYYALSSMADIWESSLLMVENHLPKKFSCDLCGQALFRLQCLNCH